MEEKVIGNGPRIILEWSILLTPLCLGSFWP